MPFSNSIYKAYLDLATYGPMESSMYERFTQLGEQDNKKSDKTNKTSKFLKILLFLLIIFIIIYLFFS